jgi:hypothetical protein
MKPDAEFQVASNKSLFCRDEPIYFIHSDPS